MDLKSVHDIFKDRILRIPSYQRGYSWSNNKPANPDSDQPLKNVKGQLKDIWDDIMNINGGWHYTGLLTLVEVEEKDYDWLANYEQFAIVDGQQRITTILILLSVIIERSKELNFSLGIREGDVEFQYLYFTTDQLKVYIFGYDKDNPSDKFFRKHILRLDEVEDDSEESVYTENLKNARSFFETMVDHRLKKSNLSDVETLKVLFKTVASNLRMNEYILPEELDEYVVFETMNNRGKPLSQLEKLKNRLMYLSKKFEFSNNHIKSENKNSQKDFVDINEFKIAKQKALSDAINKAWITIYRSLGKNKLKPLDDEDFVKNHWITYFKGYSRNVANVYAIFLFDEFFNLQSVYDKKLTYEKTEKYIKSLQKCSVWWNKLNYPQFFNDSDIEIKDAILGIHRVGLKASFKPILLSILIRKDRNDFIKVINILENYSFKIFDITDRQSNTGDSKIYSLANKIYRQKIDQENTINEINEYIEEYYSFDLFIAQMVELFKSYEQQGFYKWSGIHYFLFEYDLFLRGINDTSTKASQISWEDFNNKDSIEHIYPQSAILSFKEFAKGKRSSKEKIRSDYDKIQNDWIAFKDYSTEQRRRLANSLGNLLAISSKDNASFSNDPFIFKVDQSNKGEEYKNKGYKFDSMSAMLVASENQNWTPEAILKRGMTMLEYLCNFIGEDFSQLEEINKYKILGLEFMYKPILENSNTELNLS